jgi:type I site-specific restriction endonuclease
MAGSVSPNQNPEQVARDAIDAQLRAAGWDVQEKAALNLHAGEGKAVSHVFPRIPVSFAL